MQTFHCSAILFDLDGVLVNSIPAIIEVWTKWARENDISPEIVLETIHGRRTEEVLRLLAPQLDIAQQVREIEKGITDATREAPAITGARELLASLPEKSWCVVTSGIYDLAIGRLRGAGLPIPDVFISANDVSQGKPHPEPYLKGAERLGVPPAECVVIEDAVLGIQAAHAAGMKAIALSSTHDAEELAGADATIESLSALKVQKNDRSGELEVHI